MKVIQRWRCPSCGREYESPIPVSAVQCAGPHRDFRRQTWMQVVEGPSPVERRPVKGGRR